MGASVPAACSADARISPDRRDVEAKLRAYIHPSAPEGPEQEGAFAEAVDAQLAWETLSAQSELPAGVDSLTIGSYSIRRGESGGADASPSSICSAARAILFNAGLLRRALPVARKL